MLLLQHSFVVILAEGAEQLCRLPQRGWIDAGRILPRPGHTLEINQQRAPDHSVLTHKVFRRRDLWFLFRFFCRDRRPNKLLGVLTAEAAAAQTAALRKTSRRL